METTEPMENWTDGQKIRCLIHNALYKGCQARHKCILRLMPLNGRTNVDIVERVSPDISCIILYKQHVSHRHCIDQMAGENVEALPHSLRPNQCNVYNVDITLKKTQ